jgi:hypothetical protein
MSSTENERQKLSRLADAILDDVLSTSDADILAEVDAAYIKEGRLILIEAKANAAHQILADAKVQLSAWHSDRSRRQRHRNSTDAENTFQKFRHEDPEFNQHMTMAARNGKAPTNKDKVGLDEDWADLQELEGQGEGE